MKKAALALLMGSLLFSSCNSGNGNGLIGGNGNIYEYGGVGLEVSDAASVETYTRTVTNTTTKDKDGNTTVKTTTDNSIKSGGNVVFTFKTRAGAQAAYIKGYRITKATLNGADITSQYDVNYKSLKLDLYVPSGYDCPEQTPTNETLFSCDVTKPTSIVGVGVPVKTEIYLAGGLADLAGSKGVTQVRAIDMEFFGYTQNGNKFTVPSKGVVSQGNFQYIVQDK